MGRGRSRRFAGGGIEFGERKIASSVEMTSIEGIRRIAVPLQKGGTNRYSLASIWGVPNLRPLPRLNFFSVSSTDSMQNLKDYVQNLKGLDKEQNRKEQQRKEERGADAPAPVTADGRGYRLNRRPLKGYGNRRTPFGLIYARKDYSPKLAILSTRSNLTGLCGGGW